MRDDLDSDARGGQKDETTNIRADGETRQNQTSGTDPRVHLPTVSRPLSRGTELAASDSSSSSANPLPYPARSRLVTTAESLALGSAYLCRTRLAKSVASCRYRSYDDAATTAAAGAFPP